MGLALALLLACPGSRAQAQGPQGAELAGRLGCLACHALNGPGGELAAPLDGVGTRLTAGELAIAIAYPRQRRPGPKCPAMPTSPQPAGGPGGISWKALSNHRHHSGPFFPGRCRAPPRGGRHKLVTMCRSILVPDY